MGLISTLFSFQGRLNRRPLWGFWLAVNAVNLLGFTLLYHPIMQAPLPAELTPEDMRQYFGGFDWYNVFNLALIWPSLAIAVKRAHDRNHSGWFLLLLLIPLVNLWVFIEIAFLAGTPGANRYGPDPLPFVKPGLGWFILLGHLILAAIQAYFASAFFTVIFRHLPENDRPSAPNDVIQSAPAPNTQGLRPSNI